MSDGFRGALEVVSIELRTLGFERSGMTYYRSRMGNTEIIQFQKSNDTRGDRIRITINSGVHCSVVARKLGDQAVSHEIAKAHWRKRLTDDGGTEQWLSFDAGCAKETVAAELIGAVRRVLPDLEAHANDNTLRDSWLSGRSPGITRDQRLLYLVAILQDNGAPEQLDSTIAELREIAASGHRGSFLNARLRQLGVE